MGRPRNDLKLVLAIGGPACIFLSYKVGKLLEEPRKMRGEECRKENCTNEATHKVTSAMIETLTCSKHLPEVKRLAEKSDVNLEIEKMDS